MLEKGMLVVYGSEGVCEIADIVTQSFGGVGEKRKYYVLKPKGNVGSKLFVPMDNEVLCNRIKPILTYNEVRELISDNSVELEWISDNKQRSKYYKEIFASYDRRLIFALAKRLYEIKSGKYPNITKMYTVDEDVLKKTVQILFCELSYVVDISEEQVLPFISGEIVCNEK